MKTQNMCAILALFFLTFSSMEVVASPAAIRRLPAVVEKINQLARLLKQNRNDFDAELIRIKKQLMELEPRPIYVVKDLHAANTTAWTKLDELITNDPKTASIRQEHLTEIIAELKTHTQEAIDVISKTSGTVDLKEWGEALSEVSEIIPALRSAKAVGDYEYLQEARRAAIKMQAIIDELDKMAKNNSSSQAEIAERANEVASYFRELRYIFLTSTETSVINRAETALNKTHQGYDKTYSIIKKNDEKARPLGDEMNALLDPKNGKIAEISKKVKALNAPQPLAKFLDEHPINLNIETADTLLQNAEGYAVNLAKEHGITRLELDNGIKEILHRHINLDEYKIESFSLEDLEIALRRFSSEEEEHLKNALGQNWRQYLFVIENSKTREGERLLSMADLKNDKLLQDFIATYLDNLDDLAPEYSHRLPDNLLNGFSHSHEHILQYSKVYSQQAAELKASNFLANSREEFLRAIENLKQAHDEDTILELYDAPKKALASYHRKVLEEIAAIVKISSDSLAKDIPHTLDELHDIKSINLQAIKATIDDHFKGVEMVDNLRQAYTEQLLTLYNKELNSNLSSLDEALRQADLKMAAIDKEYNSPTKAIRGRNIEAAQPIIEVEELISPSQLDDIRELVEQEVRQYQQNFSNTPARTLSDIRRRYRGSGWSMKTDGRHPHLTMAGIEFSIPLPRGSGDIGKGLANKIYKQAQAVHLAKELNQRELLSIDELKMFMESEQYRNLGIEDDFLKYGLDPIRELLGIR